MGNKQKVIIKATGEVKEIRRHFPMLGIYLMSDGDEIKICDFFIASEPWKQNANVADVLPSAALAANRAIERMINQ